MYCNLSRPVVKYSIIHMAERRWYRNMKTKKRRILPIILITLAVIAAGILGWLWFDANVDRSGWVVKDGVYCYKDFHGKRITGWLEKEGVFFYFAPDTSMVTGWQDLEGSRYYFSTSGEMGAGLGAMATGWQELDGSRYRFGSDGKMLTGWQEDGENRFYLGQDGKAVSGWQELDGSRYYFKEDGSMATGWLDLDKKYYLNEDGTPASGALIVDGIPYYFWEDGSIFHGWIDLEEGRFYYLPEGGVATGWQTFGDRTFFFDENGVMTTGWYQDGEYRYYFRRDEGMATGPNSIDGEYYYFTPDGIQVILVNADNPVPKDYEPNLTALEGEFQISETCLDAMRKMLDDCKAAGYEYTINNTYRSYDEQLDILDTRTERIMEENELDYDEARKKALESVALPGTSEHQLGLSADINGKGVDSVPWLVEHCWEYGFILRFPEEKSSITGIIYEPWHFRYVGTRVSLPMRDNGLCLEEYLGAA